MRKLLRKFSTVSSCLHVYISVLLKMLYQLWGRCFCFRGRSNPSLIAWLALQCHICTSFSLRLACSICAFGNRRLCAFILPEHSLHWVFVSELICVSLLTSYITGLRAKLAWPAPNYWLFMLSSRSTKTNVQRNVSIFNDVVMLYVKYDHWSHYN